MLLVVDIGNSNVVAGVYQGSKLRHSWRFATNRLKTADEHVVLLSDFFKQAGLKPSQIRHSILSSVVPPLIPVFEDAVTRLFGRPGLVVDHHLDLGLKIATKNPEEVGADRLVNAVAGYHQYGGPLLILDLGTATTVDAVTRDGRYVGGAIAPGVGISVEALVTRTAKLPRIEMTQPSSSIGASTVESMRSGIYHGTVGAIRELCSTLGRELAPRGPQPAIIATGGWANWLPARELNIKAVLPDLTLDGLRLIWERNQAPSRDRGRGRAHPVRRKNSSKRKRRR